MHEKIQIFNQSIIRIHWRKDMLQFQENIKHIMGMLYIFKQNICNISLKEINIH